MKSAFHRAASALGGALGTLPLIPIVRTVAARITGPPRLPGRELIDLDFKASTYAEAAVLLLGLPLAALLFGRLLPWRLERLGIRAGAWPGIGFGTSWIAWRLGLRPKFALALGILLAASSVCLAEFRRRRAGAAAAAEHARTEPAKRRGHRAAGWSRALALAAIVLCGWRFFWRPHGAIDWFEDGNLLAPAQSYLSGARPYVDTYPIHGWGADGGLDALVFRLAGPTLEVFRMRRAAMAALALGALALAGWALFRDWVWTAIAFLLGLGICPLLSERQLPAFAAAAALVAAARGGRRRSWLLAGILGGAVVFFTLDLGVFVLAGGVLAAVLLGASARGVRGALQRAGYYGAGVLAGAAPFLAVLALEDSLGAFLRVSFVELPSSITDIWGVPAESSKDLFRSGTAREWARALFSGDDTPLRWLLPAVMLSIAATVLLFRWASGRMSLVDRGALAATAVAIVAVRGVLGRADAGHLALYGVFACLPAAWLLYRAAHARRDRAWLVAALAIPLWIRLDPGRTLAILWSGIRPEASRAPTGECRRVLERGGGATVPCLQVEELAALRAYLDTNLRPDETFFDYANEAALYFLLNRRPPVRFAAVPIYESESMQREVIAAIERQRTPVVLLPHGHWTDAIDGISNEARTPLVAAYLEAHYAPDGTVGGRAVARRTARAPIPGPRPPPP